MEILKNRVVAMLLCVFIVLASTLLSSAVRLGRVVDGINDGFYDGVTYDGYKHPAIAEQLKNICGAIDGLASVAMNYDADVVALRQSSVVLKEMLNQRTTSYAILYEAYITALYNVDDVKAQLSSKNLSERDAAGLEQYASTISSASGVIDDAGYNDSVHQIRRSYLEHLPEKFFVSVSGTDTPELFA